MDIATRRDVVLEWVEREWEAYGDAKWENHRDAHLEEMRNDGWDVAGFWYNQIFQYVSRAQTLHLDNPAGRQVAMKVLTTLIDSLGMMIDAFGLPPAPGYSSGELHEWKPESLP